MSSFAAKRKARVIKVADDEGDAPGAPASTENGSGVEGKCRGRFSQLVPMGSRLIWAWTEPPKPLFGAKSGRKPFRQSGLRKSFNAVDDDTQSTGGEEARDDNDDDGPVVVRPSIGRAGSKQKKTTPKPRISFGGDPGDADNGEAEAFSTPKKAPLGMKAMENSAAKRGVPLRGLPTRTLQDDDDRPRYSKEYLSELQSSTPNTPRDISTLHIGDADEMELDASELEGALVVESPAPSPKPTTQILSEAEIREKKERRARLAKEEGFLSVEDEEEDSFGKKKDDTRLQREDEDLGEGFDDYVDDGGLSLGKRATKERRKKERQQMAELISAAEGHTSDSSSDSDAERRIAYESAQTRAGLDGLKKPTKNPANDLLQVPPKITPLPSLTECLAKLQASLKSMEDDLKTKNARVEQLRREKQEIVTREGEVQALLDETGRKYQEAMGRGKTEAVPGANAAQATLELPGERGLESLGTTPRRADEDVDML
ncbi:fungal specific transcription factor domain-containing protein [Purpureocillium lavendulum]|uniref:Fungal specific transcription factor domain-containing protein n=1 Tax=Purpureocillium lavendulum TaxID=1247861 RepID=A0AB34FWU5_9HYPO|nr:fungal specific transcription factor domain-containing protein [Purpureocillium lavendulum]